MEKNLLKVAVLLGLVLLATACDGDSIASSRPSRA